MQLPGVCGETDERAPCPLSTGCGVRSRASPSGRLSAPKCPQDAAVACRVPEPQLDALTCLLGTGDDRLILLLCQKIVVRGVDLGWGLRTPKGQPKAWCYGREMTQCTDNSPSLEVL